MTPHTPPGVANAPARRNERGVALLAVVMVITLITIVVTELAYDSKVELMAAQNFKDELRAHYLLRSSADLSRLLFKIQSSVIDRAKIPGIDVQVPHYAPYLIGAFADQSQAEGLGSLLGVDASAAKGLGVEAGTIEAEIQSEDGKINLNCVANATATKKVALELEALLSPAQFNPLFERADAEGEHHDRTEIIQALIDWADADEVRFDPAGGSAPEDYGYESERDPYKARNAAYDTPGEIRMVRGIDEDFMRIFGDALTIWGGGHCKIHVNEASPLVLLALILESAQNQQELLNPARFLETLQLAVFLYDMRMMFGGGFADLKDAKNTIENPDTLVAMATLAGLPMLTPPQGVKLDQKKFNQAAQAGARRIWHLKASAEVGRVRRQLHAVWDMKRVSQATQGEGMWVYWREE